MEGPLVIKVEIGGHAVHRMYVDGGSSMEVLYEHCFDRLWRCRAFYEMMDEFNDSEFLVNGGIVTIRSTILTSTECATIVATPKDSAKKAEGQAPERSKAIQVEVQKLVEVGILREVYYHDWFSNLVMVKKHDASWRMCVDFTHLNKAYPQDCYPLPEIDWKIKSLCGYPFKCFLDAYKGYHQIQMAEQDEEKTAFHTSHGINQSEPRDICGRLGHQESHGNRAATGYRRNILRDKTVPRQDGGRVTTPIPMDNQREVHKNDFHWMLEAEQAFKQLKQHLAKLPMLVAPKPKEELMMYLSASYRAISAVLMTERDIIQTLIYFVSRALQASKINYTSMEKLVLALVCATKRLRRYFQAHPIVVITDQPIKQVISPPDVERRLQKWSVILGEHNITYRSRTSVKGQILADFLVEKPYDVSPEASLIETLQEL
ncbi:reverse transcriptase domain-containing protein [Tanacetum coccineum]